MVIVNLTIPETDIALEYVARAIEVTLKRTGKPSHYISKVTKGDVSKVTITGDTSGFLSDVEYEEVVRMAKDTATLSLYYLYEVGYDDEPISAAYYHKDEVPTYPDYEWRPACQ